MNGFDLPQNVKQIGAIGEGMRVYMEDYVSTYLKQYSDSGGHGNRQAFLIGKHMIIDGKPYLFINGAVLGKHCENADGLDVFTEKSFEYVNEQIERFFNGYEVVGEMRAQPGYGAALTPSAARAHTEAFVSRRQVLLLTDPIERVNCFYAWNDAYDGLREIGGYFIYYEKNAGMQEYMLENKIMRPAITKDEEEKDDYEEEADSREKSPERKTLFKPAAPVPEYKKMFNMFAGVSAVLFVVCFLMAASLIQGDSRINKLEEGFTALDSAYNYLLSQASTYREVFASVETAQVIADAEKETAREEETQTEAPAVPPNDSQSEADSAEEEAFAAAEEDEPASVIPGTVVIVDPNEPTKAPEPPPNQSPVSQATDVIPREYVVAAGDNLNSISVRFYGDKTMVDAIMTKNGISDPNMIYFGQVLLLPEKP